MSRTKAPNDAPLEAREGWLKAKFHASLRNRPVSTIERIDAGMVVGNVLRYTDLPDDVTLDRAKELAADAIAEQLDHRRD